MSTKTDLAPATLGPKNTQGDLSRMATVFGCLGMILLMGTLTLLTVGVEWVYTLRPEGVKVDKSEMLQASKLIEQRTEELDQLSKENEAVLTWVASRREHWNQWDAGDQATQGSGGSSQQTDPQVNTPVHRFMADAASACYGKLFAVPDQGRRKPDLPKAFKAIDQLGPDQRERFAKLLESGIKKGHADVEVAALTLERLQNQDLTRDFIRILVANPDPVGGELQHIKEEEFARVILGLCSSLPGTEHADAIAKLSFHYLQPNAVVLGEIRKAIAGVDDENAHRLAPLILHPVEEFKSDVAKRIPEAVLIDMLISGTKQNDYLRYVFAVRRLAEQPVSDVHRQSVLDSLATVLLIPIDGDFIALRTYTKWADGSCKPFIEELFAKPITNREVVAKLIQLAMREKFDLKSLIENSHPLMLEHWFASYQLHPDELSAAIRSVLLADTPKSAMSKLMQAISETGNAKDRELLTETVKHLDKIAPDSLLANSSKQFLEQMQLRLRKEN